MTVKETFNKAQWQDVAAELAKAHPGDCKDITGYRKAFNAIMAMTPTETGITLTLERSVVAGVPVVDVRAWQDGSPWSIMFLPWSEILGMQLDERCLEVMPLAEIAAHILFDMTWFGFAEEEINAAKEKIIMEDSDLLTGDDADKF